MDNLQIRMERSLQRLLPRLDKDFASAKRTDPHGWQIFRHRLETHFPTLFGLYHRLYSTEYDFFYHLEDLLHSLARMWLSRTGDLRTLDSECEADPIWFQDNSMVGGVIYVDLFAGNLAGVKAKIPYFKELGLTYLHLMPLFKAPEGENDGGYAVSSYRDVNPALGTLNDLTELAQALRSQGISLVLDLVFNHTSDEHLWAEKAKQGDQEAREFYRIFPDHTIPDEYEKSMREIFPDEHPGAFTFRPDVGGWVWTTFHSYQWDLNYANPAVFNRMAEEMLFLANTGVAVLRLDAVAFIWKKMGTTSENLEEAHLLIQTFNAVARIAAPALIFKSEAIVHPDEVVRYISPKECQLSYNPLLMALIWESLATHKIHLLRQAMTDRYRINSACSWVNYVRSHDDIGWTFSDEDAAQLGISGFDHRRFLNSFYTGRFAGSFARGLPFQENPQTGDARISGTCASLAGLEKALHEEGTSEVNLAIKRIMLIHAIILTAGGIPLIYLGDEIGILNDYSYRKNPSKAADSRWVHRPAANWDKIARRNQPDSYESRIFNGLKQLITLRKSYAAFAGGSNQSIPLDNDHVLGYIRQRKDDIVLIFANFSLSEQVVSANLLRIYGAEYQFTNLLTSQPLPPGDLILGPYAFVCLRPGSPR